VRFHKEGLKEVRVGAREERGVNRGGESNLLAHNIFHRSVRRHGRKLSW
jgi:hypothetical protein